MMISTNHHQQPPQSHSVARRASSGGARLCLFVLTLMVGAVRNVQSTLYKEPLFIDDLLPYFGPDGCIEGSLVMTPTVPVVVQQMQDNHVTSTVDTEKQGSQDDSVTSSSDPSGASGKEKTPMCLVNELARFNKIEHQYRLTCEEGPPHRKKFTVTLKLGTEEYTADGPSIKKAQHSAASIALEHTNYKHPPPKASRNLRQGKGNITPTVELNALAMKRGEPTIYTLVEMPQYTQYGNPYNYHQRGMYSQRYYGGKGVYKVTVKVGEKEFNGEGSSAQAARHDAAATALQTLRNLPFSAHHNSTTCEVDGGTRLDADSSSELKSPISLVHEIALKRNLPVIFEVVSENGPPHMRTFVTRCLVGEKFETVGEGNGKKVSKKRAAEKMLEQLRTLPPTTTVTAAGCVGNLARMKRKTNTAKKKSRNLIKDTVTTTPSTQDQKYETDGVEEINPISRLIQIQQAKKEKEPVYTLREERGMPRRREFVMEVAVGEHSYIGTGPNKKLAKRNAAEGLLQSLGYSSPTVTRSGHQLPQHNKVRFADEKSSSGGNIGGVSGRQLVPGLLLMNDNKAANGNPHQHNSHKHSGVNLKTTATIAKEYLNDGNSPTADALAGHNRGKTTGAVRPTDQLLYLAQVLNFQVQFSDFPKGNHSEYLSLVTLGTDPPQVCHGAGGTTEISQDQAALNALRSLSEMGLDSITPAKKDQTNINPGPANEGLYMGLSSNMPKDDTYVNGK